MDGSEPKPTRDQRDVLRQELLAAGPRFYSPTLHLLLPAVFGLGIVAAALWQIEALHPIELLTLPAVFLMANATEWRAHRDLLHKRWFFSEPLYTRHTLAHHRVFVTHDMAMRNQGEWLLVLLPAYGILMIFVGTAPLIVGLWLVGLPNVAMLFGAAAMFYVLSYEWLHLSYHLPETHSIGGARLIRRLRRHHAVHHDPRLMQTHNFNVTVPLWDWVRGTTATPQESEHAWLAASKSPPSA